MNHYSPKTELKGLIVFIITIFLLLLTIKTIAKNETTTTLETKATGSGYYLPSYDEKIEWEREIHFKKLSIEMIEVKKKKESIKPVLRGKLKGYESFILNTCFNGDYTKAKVYIALIGLEATYGESKMAVEQNNFNGIKVDGKFKTFKSIEEGLCGAKLHIGKYIKEFAQQPTQENMTKVFWKYCAPEDGIPCGHRDGTLWNIYYNL